MLTVRACTLAARSATRRWIASSRGRARALPGLPLVGGRDARPEDEEHVVRFALQRPGEQGGVRAGDRELAALQPGRGRVVAGEAHALATLRGWVVLTPGWDCASG